MPGTGSGARGSGTRCMGYGDMVRTSVLPRGMGPGPFLTVFKAVFPENGCFDENHEN